MSACWVTTTESPTAARLEPAHLTYGRIFLFSSLKPNLTNFADQWVAMDGTSASTPAFAGMITLINQMRISVYLHLSDTYTHTHTHQRQGS